MPTEDWRLLPLRNQKREIVAYAKVDADVFEEVSSKRWYLGSGYVRHSGPYDETGRQTIVVLHRYVMGCEPGDGLKVDHINHDTLDNRRSNLRVGTHAQNHQNRTSNGNRNTTSRYRGVSWCKAKGKWIAHAKLNQKQVYLGEYVDEDEAAQASAAWRAENMPWAMN